MDFMLSTSSGKSVIVEEVPRHEWKWNVKHKTTYLPNEYTAYIVLYEHSRHALKNIVYLFSTCEAIDGRCARVEVLLCKEGKENDMFYAVSDCLVRDTAGIVLYDQTGKFDDISCFPSHSIIVENESSLISLSDDFHPYISKERRERIREWLRISCMCLFIDSSARSITDGDFDFDNVQELVNAMSFGHIEVQFTQEDTHDYLSYDTNAQTPDGLFALSCALLASNNAGIIEEEEGAMMQCCADTSAVMEIWERACAMSGVPVSLNGDAGSYKPDKKMIRKLGELLGVDSMVEAYFRGVPLEDILA